MLKSTKMSLHFHNFHWIPKLYLYPGLKKPKGWRALTGIWNSKGTCIIAVKWKKNYWQHCMPFTKSGFHFFLVTDFCVLLISIRMKNCIKLLSKSLTIAILLDLLQKSFKKTSAFDQNRNCVFFFCWWSWIYNLVI